MICRCSSFLPPFCSQYPFLAGRVHGALIGADLDSPKTSAETIGGLKNNMCLRRFIFSPLVMAALMTSGKLFLCCSCPDLQRCKCANIIQVRKTKVLPPSPHLKLGKE